MKVWMQLASVGSRSVWIRFKNQRHGNKLNNLALMFFPQRTKEREKIHRASYSSGFFQRGRRPNNSRLRSRLWFRCLQNNGGVSSCCLWKQQSFLFTLKLFYLLNPIFTTGLPDLQMLAQPGELKNFYNYWSIEFQFSGSKYISKIKLQFFYFYCASEWLFRIGCVISCR